MAASQQPTQADLEEAVRITLFGLANGEDPNAILQRLSPLHPRHHTFPGEELLDLAADAIEESGASRSGCIDYEGIREKHLAEYEFRGRAGHHKSHYALTAAAMIRAGVYPDLVGETQWWTADDLWIFAFYALLAYLRVAAERTGRPVEQVARSIADRRSVNIDPAGA